MNEQNFYRNTTADGTSDFSEWIRPEYSQNDTVFAWLSILMGFVVARAVPISKYSLGMTVEDQKKRRYSRRSERIFAVLQLIVILCLKRIPRKLTFFEHHLGGGAL